MTNQRAQNLEATYYELRKIMFQADIDDMNINSVKSRNYYNECKERLQEHINKCIDLNRCDLTFSLDFRMFLLAEYQRQLDKCLRLKNLKQL